MTKDNVCEWKVKLLRGEGKFMYKSDCGLTLESSTAIPPYHICLCYKKIKVVNSWNG